MKQQETPKVSDYLKIAQTRFDSGEKVAYIPLWGDPGRTRNFAGIWIEKKYLEPNKTLYKFNLVGRLLGQGMSTEPCDSFNLKSAINRALTIWSAYKYPPDTPA